MIDDYGCTHLNNMKIEQNTKFILKAVLLEIVPSS